MLSAGFSGAVRLIAAMMLKAVSIVGGLLLADWMFRLKPFDGAQQEREMKSRSKTATSQFNNINEDSP